MFEYMQAEVTTFSHGNKRYKMDGIEMEGWYMELDFLNAVGRIGWELIDLPTLTFKRKI